MKKLISTKYVAFDGQSFDSKEACQAHEEANWQKQFVGLKAAQVEAAFKREGERGVALADAFELAARRIERVRMAQGDRRRAVKTPRNTDESQNAASLAAE